MNELNIAGDIGVDLLTEAFSLISFSAVNAIANDLTARGIPLLFTDPGTFEAFCADAVACFIPSPNSEPPATPVPIPVLLFNPAYLDETPATIAAVIVHEGTHFQEYLDGRLYAAGRGTVDNEFDAFWNEAVFWQDTRASQSPFTTGLEEEEEAIYQTALQGEAELRDHIAALYCDGAADC